MKLVCALFPAVVAACGSNPSPGSPAPASDAGANDGGVPDAGGTDAGGCPGYFFSLSEFFLESYGYANTSRVFALKFNKKPDLTTIVMNDPPSAATDTIWVRHTPLASDAGVLLPLRLQVPDAGPEERLVEFFQRDASVVAEGRYAVHVEGGNGSGDSVNDSDTLTGVKSDPICAPVLFYDRAGQGALHPADEDTDYAFDCTQDGGTFSCRAADGGV